jgi:hypothetical protein
MATCVYLCPNTGQRVQVRLPTTSRLTTRTYKSVTGTRCPACRQVHFVNPATGNVLSIDHEYASLRAR